MKQIPLSQGKFALVDDEDYEWLNQWKWCAHKLDNVYYAHRRDKNLGSVSMHRTILGLTDPKIIGDHKDGDGLNNQRSNLRSCTASQNSFNRRLLKSLGRSKFKGVSWDKDEEMWRVRISFGGKRIHIGRFSDVREAAIAYNLSAVEHHGEFACLNVII